LEGERPLKKQEYTMAEVKIQAPAGMTDEEAKKAFAAFIKQRVETKARDKAIAQATKDLRTKYGPEYQALVAKYQGK